MNSKTTFIKSELTKLSNILNSINIIDITAIKDLHNSFFKKMNLSNITDFIIELSQLRIKLKTKINKYEREIVELDKNIIEKKTHKKINKINKDRISDKLYHLHKVNDYIKITLKNIILKIK